MTAFDAYPLSHAQRAEWESTRNGAESVSRARIGLAAPLDGDRLRRALHVLAERHEALRLRFVHRPELNLPLQTTANEADRLMVTASAPATPAADGTDGVLHVSLTETELVLSASALAVDTAGLEILLQELARTYLGEELPDDGERLQFLDIVEWQREEEKRSSDDRTTLADSPAAGLVLAPHGAAGARGDTEFRAAVTGSVNDRLRAVAQDRGHPVEDLVAAAWLLALSRYADTHPDDEAALRLAVYDSGRSTPGVTEVVGALSGHLPLSLPLPLPTGSVALCDAVARALTTVRRESLVSEPLRGADAAPAGFTVVHEPALAALAALGAVRVVVEPARRFGALDLVCAVGPDTLALTVRNDPAGCPETTAERLLDSVVAVLTDLSDALCADRTPSAAGAAEWRLLTEWGGAGVDSAGGGAEETLSRLLDDGITGADGERLAVVATDGTLTFAELDATANAVAARLVDAGVQAQDRVAVLADRSWRTVAAFVGVLRAGAVYVPVDRAQPTARLRELLRLIGASCVVHGGSDRSADDFGQPLATIEVEKAAAGDPVRDTGRQPLPGDAAYVVFTSGSTGTPRPVVVEHSAAAHLYEALKATVYRSEREPLNVAVNAPFVFDASMKQLLQLASGSTLYLVPAEAREDGTELLNYLTTHRVDVLDCTPSHLGVLLAAAGDAAQRLSRVVLIGGEAVDPELWKTLGALENVRCFNLYGPTECTVDVTVQEISARPAPAIGQPVPGLRTWVLDHAQRPVAPGAPGELCVSGPQLARGYFGDPAATDRRFVTVPLPDGEAVRLYRTGDRVRYAEDGCLEYLGRLDDQVKLNGFRVELGEVSSVLVGHPGVRQATAAVVREENEAARLIAYAVPEQAAPVLNPDEVEGINAHETRYLYDEIFVQQVYLRGGVALRERSVVFDIGANIGMFSLFARAVCPDAEVYAFEPLTQVYEKLERNTAGHGGDVRIFPYGLSDGEASVPFTFYPGYSMMSGQHEYSDPSAEIGVIKRFLSNSRDQGNAQDALLLEEADELLEGRFTEETQTGLVRRLSDVIDEQGVERIDLLKVDVQRAELAVLGGLDDRHWPLVQQIAMEVHDQDGAETEGRLAEVTTLLEKHGFRVVVEQDALLHGTDRHALYAVRPEYAADPRPVHPASVPQGETTPVDGRQLLDWLAERLPAYAVPADVVLLDAIPLTNNGKVDRSALPTPARAQRDSYAKPENASEELLVEIWREVLGREHFGTEDRFFDLGGDSIRGIRMRAVAARRGLTFPLRDIFRYQTIRGLVRDGGVRLASDVPVETVPTAPTSADQDTFRLVPERDRAALPTGLVDAYPLSALQLGMVYHAELSPDRTAYHVVTVHRVQRALSADALRSALADTAAAHPALRTSFEIGRFSEPLQLVHGTVEVPFEVVATMPDERAGRVSAVVAEEHARPFTWSRAPLVRLRAVDSGTDSFELVCTHHHAIVDGWSLHLFLEELLGRYDAAVAQKAYEPSGDAPAVPYRRFVELEREARDSRETERFWTKSLRTATSLLLAADGAERHGCPARLTSMREDALPGPWAGRLAALAEQRGVPLKSLLLAVHLRALAEESGRDEVVSGLVVSGRPAEEGGDRTIGLFLNTLPVVASIGEGPLLELAGRVWQAEREWMGHHLMPLADIQSALGRGPLFDVLFNFTRFHELADGPARHSTQNYGVASDVAYGLVVDFQAAPAGDGLLLSFQYDGSVLPQHRVDGLAKRYRELLELLLDAPDTVLSALGAAVGSDGGPAAAREDRVRAVWQELTGVLPQPQDDFFGSGGDSLLAVRFVAMLRDRHGIELRLCDLLRAARRYTALVELVRTS